MLIIDIKSLSFGALSKAQKSLEEEQRRYDSEEDEQGNSDSDSDGPPEESSASSSGSHKRRSKHAPAESSFKKPVSWIREVPGLVNKKTSSSLYRDIRFDPAYGKSDLQETRKNYAFLNEYREKELQDMKKMVKTTKDENEKSKLKTAIQALESRLKTFKDRDFEREVIAKHTKEARKNNYHLKKSELKKLVLTEKFKTMKKKDVNHALERRRKKNTAKERKQMPLQRRA
ncbi:Rrp36p [Sugiyamaella lignohabitans]|uniref:rRNA biogenesis protein RRP36 n=1 Tax=Sugiyamaella lignohabitans TaxID=796027 RepID=A0A167F3X3_9ASCO|nr:Rrp36p [Sugiyamaella lignohabitans]ANB14798.1 Rrp36p [Sugiyamaella lignohabitans]